MPGIWVTAGVVLLELAYAPNPLPEQLDRIVTEELLRPPADENDPPTAVADDSRVRTGMNELADDFVRQ